MVFVTLESGCFVCLSHKTNADGYLRKTWGNARTGDRIAEMFHRFIFRAHKGPIPEGHEVDHMCRTRACCNPDHLQAIPRPEHLEHTNRTRYADRMSAAKAWWMKTKCKGVELASKFNVTFGSACGWIRGWRKEAECH